MSVSWDASELNALAADLGQAGHSATRKAQQAVIKSAHDVEAHGKRLAPVDTGALMNSIGADVAADSLSAEIGPTVHYGAYVEFGTSRPMAPQPYMSPALDAVTPGFVAAMESLGGDIL